MTLRALVFVMCTLVIACERQAPEGIVAHASFGLFFGGQIQERDEIPFSLDRTKQRQGFRIEFRAPLPAPQQVRWEIEQPAPRRQGRKVVLGEATARAGATSFEQELPFVAGDPLGTWNVRVTIADEAAIDRPVLIYDVQARKRAKEAEEQSDEQK